MKKNNGHLSILCIVVGLCWAASEAVVFGPNSWAVLVAGSKGWINYRHQADICHAYQILIQKGVDKEKIITLMYDDIAFNEENPMKGMIINRPNGPDVYKGVVIDYRGENITKINLLNILEGNETAMKNIGSGRVLKSTENDTVFINFVDHGGHGLLCLPNEVILANELIATLNKMGEKKMFGNARGFADKLISSILKVYTEEDVNSQIDLETTRLKLHLNMFSCYNDLLKAFETNCFSIPKNPYILSHLYKFANICVKDKTSTKAVTAIQTVCRDNIETINNLDINI